jgi:WD40 repeat protein
MNSKPWTFLRCSTKLIPVLLLAAGCQTAASDAAPTGPPTSTLREATFTPTMSPTATPSPTATREPRLASFLAPPLADGAVARLGKGRIYDLALSPDGGSVALASPTGVYRYRLEDSAGTAEEMWFVPTTVPMTRVAFSADGSMVAAGASNDHAAYRSEPDRPQNPSARDPGILLLKADSGEPLAAVDFSAAGMGYSTGCLAFSPDGSRLSAAYIFFSGGSQVFLYITSWNLPNGVTTEWSYKYDDQISYDSWKGVYMPVPPKSLAFSPDGSLLAFRMDPADEIKILDARGGEPIRSLDGGGKDFDYLAFSPEGKWFASGADDGTVALWDAEQWKLKRTLTGSGKKNPTPIGGWNYFSASSALAFSSDGETLAAGSFHGAVTLWNPSTGARLRTLAGHSGPVAGLAFAAQDGGLRSAALDGTILLHDPANGELADTHLLGGHEAFRQPVLSPDGKFLFSSSDHGGAVWHIAGRKILHEVSGESVVVSPDTRLLAVETEHHTIELWETSRWEKTFTLAAHSRDVTALAFSPDGKRLASGSDDHTVVLWDTDTGAKLFVFRGYSFPIYRIAFSPDGNTLAAEGRLHSMLFWNAATGEKQAEFFDYQYNPDLGAFSPDGRILACPEYTYGAHSLLLLDTATGGLISVTPIAQWPGANVFFSPDGSAVVYGDGTSDMELLDITGRSDFHLPQGGLSGPGLSFSADGIRGAGADFWNVVVWDIASGTLIHRFRGHTGKVGATYYSSDGNLLVSDSYDGTIFLWEVSG